MCISMYYEHCICQLKAEVMQRAFSHHPVAPSRTHFVADGRCFPVLLCYGHGLGVFVKCHQQAVVRKRLQQAAADTSA